MAPTNWGPSLRIGLGTWQNTVPDQCRRSVRTALDHGYRHVDTARAYENERFVGEAITSSDVPREEVFVATKIFHPEFTSEYTYHAVRDAVLERLDALGLEYVDLMYAHWPTEDYDPATTMRAFGDLYDDGVIDHIGVCNHTPEDVDAVRDADPPDLFVNQVEMHPLLPQRGLREYLADEGIRIAAHTPLCRGAVFGIPELQAIAATRGVSRARVSIAWLLEKGAAPIPKATSAEHIRDNLEGTRLSLSPEEVERIDRIPDRHQFCNPPYSPDWTDRED